MHLFRTKEATPPKDRYASVPLERRRQESKAIREKHPDRVPVILEKVVKATDDLPVLSKYKYLVPGDLLWQEFRIFIRKRMQLKPEQTMFIFVNSTFPLPTMTLNQIYTTNQDEAGFLSCVYAAENTFGEPNETSPI